MKKALHILVFILAATFVLSSCKPQKDLAEGQYLLHKQSIKLSNYSKAETKAFYDKIDADDLEGILKQKPNKRLLRLYKLHLQLYTYGNRKDNWWRRWLKNIGEEPSILDTNKTRISTEQLKLFLKKKGYFMAESWDSTTYLKKKRASIQYSILPREAYKVKKVSYYIEDAGMVKDVSNTTRATMINPGDNYDEYVLDKERNRVERSMKNKGYYNFSKQFVFFTVDSINKQKGVDIEVKIKRPSIKRVNENGTDTTLYVPHKKYYLKDIYISVENRSGKMTNLNDTMTLNGYQILNHGHGIIRPYVILRALFFKPGDLYSLENIEYSYERLGNLRAFKSINISVFPDPANPDSNQLSAFVDLSPNARHSFIAETEGTNRQGNLGVSGNINFTNRNTFKGAEVLELKFLGGLEAQNVDNTVLEDEGSGGQSILEDSPFNTLEYGFQSSLRIPGLWIPKKVGKIPNYTKPNTSLSVGYNHQVRSAYRRDISNARFSYNWYLNRKHGFTLSPVDLSFVRIDKAAWFEQRLIDSKNSLLYNSYQNHLIAATIFKYEFTNQKNMMRNYTFFRTSLESAGNMLRTIDETFGFPIVTDSAGDYYTTFGIRYAQYVKADGDIRLYNVITEETRSVYRFYAGIGVPLENLNVLPFEKSFFGGGANNNRAWVARTMGPGGMPDTVVNVDKIGDLKFEANWEFRFKVIGNFDLAYFIDVGNIWLRVKDEKRPLAEFDINRFYKEIAVGTGLGIRFDLNFFIIRVDGGYRLHDPIYPEGERWAWQSKDKYTSYREKILSDGQKELTSDPAFRGINFNFGIGYPF